MSRTNNTQPAIRTLVTYKDLRDGTFFHMVQLRFPGWTDHEFQRRLQAQPGFDFPVKVEEIWTGEASVKEARVEARKLFPGARFIT